MPTVAIRFTALPAHVRTARMFAVAVARRARVDDNVLDEVRLAVGEACSRAVALHRDHAASEPVTMRLRDDEQRFTVEVIDSGPSSAEVPDLDDLSLESGGRESLPPGVGLAVITGLVDDVSVTPREPVGTVVAMSWPTPRAGRNERTAG